MKKRVQDSVVFGDRRRFPYLAEEDRFLGGDSAPDFSFGFIGCGMMGLEHMRNAELLGRARIGGVYDPVEKNVEHALVSTRGSGDAPAVYGSLEEACADPDTDALIIATPNFTHLEVLRVALRHHKAVLLEKPIATTIDDAYEVSRLAAAHGKPVRPGLQYRYKAIYAEAIGEVFERQRIGQVQSVNMLEHRFPFLDKVGQWNKFNAYTGGTLVEKCCHYFDLMNLFAAGKPERVFGIGSQAVNFRDFAYANRKADGIDQAHVSIEYDNGVIGAFSLSMFVPGTREELVVCGDTGRVQVSEQSRLGEPNENSLDLWSGENGASFTSSPTYPSHIARAGHHGSTFFEHAAFVADLERGVVDGPSMADAFWAVVVGAAAQTSIERGVAVSIDEVLPANFDSSAMVCLKEVVA